MKLSAEERAAGTDPQGYPHWLEMRGAPRSLTWPDVCAQCGGAATERVRVRRAFYRRARGRQSRGLFGYQVVTVDLPLCGPCGVRHRETVPRVSWFRRYRWWVLNPAHVATIGFAVPLAMLRPTEPKLAGIFLFGIVWTIGITWWMSRPDRFEPLSEITSACVISQDVSEFFEARRHRYGFRNRIFAEAFERVNQAQVWTERDQTRAWKKSLVATILVVVVIGGARLLLWYYEGR